MVKFISTLWLRKLDKNMKKQKLIIGDIAPNFCLPNQDEKDVCLNDYKGKNVILYFYPKNNTPGCSLEAMMFTKYKENFEKLNTTILGVSKDSCMSHKKFIEYKKLNLTLISDIEKEIHKKYGVWRKKQFMGREFLGTIRTTFLIDKNRKIIKIWDNVRVKGHAEDVLKEVKDLK
jgi:peroxiredoxin Q/BCP